MIFPLEPQPEPRGTLPSGGTAWYWRSERLDTGYCHTGEDAFRRLAEKACPFAVPGDRVRVECRDGVWVWVIDNATGESR